MCTELTENLQNQATQLRHTKQANLTSLADYDSKLDEILESNGLYEDLHQVLHENDVDLTMLQRDLKPQEINEFCTDIGLNIKQQIMFKRLMRIIDNSQNVNEMNDISRMSNLEQLIDMQIQLESTTDARPVECHAGEKYIDDKMIIILIGDAGAGKTSLMRRYFQGTFEPGVTATTGIDTMTNIQPLSDDTNVEITVWDTAGILHSFRYICCVSMNNTNYTKKDKKDTKAFVDHFTEKQIVYSFVMM